MSYIAVCPWVITKLQADAAMQAVFGANFKILFNEPNNFEILPIMTYFEADQGDFEGGWFDNTNSHADEVIHFDLWFPKTASLISALSAVDAVMKANLFTRKLNSDVPEPNTKIRHRTMQYRRVISNAGLI